MVLKLCYCDAMAIRGLSSESMTEIPLSLGGSASRSNLGWFDFPNVEIDHELPTIPDAIKTIRVKGNVSVRSLFISDMYPRHVIVVTLASTVVHRHKKTKETPDHVDGVSNVSKDLDEMSWHSLANAAALACSSGVGRNDALSLGRICRDRNSKIGRAAKDREATVVVGARREGGLCLADRPYMNGSAIEEELSDAESFELLQTIVSKAIAQQVIVEFAKKKIREFRNDRRFVDLMSADQNVTEAQSGRDVGLALLELQVVMRQLSEISYRQLGCQTQTQKTLNRHLGTDLELNLLPMRIAELNDEIGLRLLATLTREIGAIRDALPLALEKHD